MEIPGLWAVSMRNGEEVYYLLASGLFQRICIKKWEGKIEKTEIFQHFQKFSSKISLLSYTFRFFFNFLHIFCLSSHLGSPSECLDCFSERLRLSVGFPRQFGYLSGMFISLSRSCLNCVQQSVPMSGYCY